MDTPAQPVPPGAMMLELVMLPVSDIDRAIGFYRDRAGFTVDVDVRPAPGVRVVQLTPPGSHCSVSMTTGMADTGMPPGSLRGLHLVVADLEAARAGMIQRGVEMGPVQDLGGVLYSWFTDPDGNTWTLQHMPWRS